MKAVCAGRILLLPLVGLLSCAPREQGVLLDTQRTTAARLTELMHAKDRRVKTIAGRGTLSFETPSISGSAGFLLAMVKPDSMLVKLEGPFGLSVGLMFLSRDRFVMYNSFENTVTTGVPTAGALHTVIPVELSYDEAFSAFCGTIALPDMPPSTYSVDDGRFLLTYVDGGRRSSYWIDPELLLVRRFTVVDGGGETIIDARTSGSFEADDASIPRRMVLSMPSTSRQLTVAFSSASLNDGVPSFAYAVPENARRNAIPNP